MSTAVTVLMAVFNGAAYLSQALESVLDQEFHDFEFIIVDDGSTDGTSEILALVTDPRVQIIRNDRNLGLTRSLNVGLDNATGEFIARMDADDRCMPNRLSVQHSFMNKHPDHVAVASGYVAVNENGHKLWSTRDGLDDWQVRWLLGFNPPAPHPTYFFRRLRNDGTSYRYDERFWTAQDFELWSRFAEEGKVAVLADRLIEYRRHSKAITAALRKEQAGNCRVVGRRNLGCRLPNAVVEKLDPLIDMFAYDATADVPTIAAAVSGCDAMLAHDLPLAPSRRHYHWTRQIAAGLLADAILSRSGALRSPFRTAAFLYHARAYLPWLCMAVLDRPGIAIKSLRAAGRING